MHKFWFMRKCHIFRSFFGVISFLCLIFVPLGADARGSNLQNGKINNRSESLSIETTPQVEALLNRFEKRFVAMDSLVFRTPAIDESFESVLDTTIQNSLSTDRVAAVDNSVDAQIAEMKSKTGLDIRGQAYVRPGAGVSYDPDDPLVAYNAKFQAELEWNIFHSAIYKRASKIKELKLKGELRQLDYARDGLEDAIVMQKQLVRSRHFGRMLSLLNQHAENVSLLMDAQLFLLEHGKISSDDLLKLINEQTELERQLIAIKVDSVVSELPPFTGVAYISVTDTAGIIRSITDNNLELRRLGLQHEILGVQRHNIDYVQTMDILPFARYSYYNRQNVHNTYNFDIGVSFKIPITSEVSKKRKSLAAEQDIILYEQQQLENETEKEIYLVFSELESYNENIRGEYLRMKSLKKYLDMRTQSYGNVDGEYSRINRLMEYNAYLQAWERLLDYVYRRDCKLIELQSFLITEPISNYLEFTTLD